MSGSQYGYHHGHGGGGNMGGNPYSNSSPLGQKPKVGLAVVCRCAAANSYVQCLLQRRGLHSSSPNKWSFPGGRLEHPGDLEDDGAVGTKRELNEECGGGAPLGLPPLIHIECCKTGKQNQTLYHVYVVDTSHDKEWESWQPKSRNGKSTTDVDTVVASLLLQNSAFPCTNGYCWVNMGLLIQECYGMSQPDMGNSDLQHGLVRWVQNYGEHILKILIARSPKLHHSRRLSNTIATPFFQNGHLGAGSPRQGPPRLDSSGGKPRRFGGGVRGGGGMLQPPFSHAHFPQHNFHVGSSPTNTFYNLGVMPPSQSQMSPPTGGANVLATPTNSVGNIQGYPGGMIMHVPPSLPPQSSPQAAGGQGLLYMSQPQPMLMMPPPPLPHAGDPPLSHQPSSPTISSPSLGGVAKPEGGGEGLYLPPQNLISTLAPLMATSSVVPPVSAPQPPLNPGQPGGGIGGFDPLHSMHLNAGGVATTGAMFPNIADSSPISVGQFLPAHSPLGALPPHHPPPPLHPALPHTPGHTPQGESEPLLPNPPVPLLPLVHPIQTAPPQQPGSPGSGAPFPPQLLPDSSRKEILCRHFMVQGHCPFGEKCWFAHPHPADPLLMGGGQHQPPRPEGLGGGMSSSPLHIQVPQKFWLNNPLADYNSAVASPPQSPLNPALMSRPPIIPAMYRPRGGLPYSNQHPFLFLRGPPMPGHPRLPVPNLPLIQPSPIPMPLNPILKFGLLSQVDLPGHEGGPTPVVDEEGPTPVADAAQLGTYADHFFVSCGSNINTYRIIFGGGRNYQESAMLTEKKKVEQNISCLLCSPQQPMLLLLGTEQGGVSLLDMRKGVGHGNITQVYSAETPPPSEAVSSLIHFTTSINSAQVVVTGSQGGMLAWHISQPPQKTFSLLFLDRDIHVPNRVVSLQMLGGLLVSGDASGKIAVWNMMNQTPSIHSLLNTHSLSLTDLHVVDANHFITVGNDRPSGTIVDTNHFITVGNDRPPVAGDDASSSSGSKTLSTPPEPFNNLSASDGLSLDISKLSVRSTEEGGDNHAATSPPEMPAASFIKFWEYGTPPKVVRCVEEANPVLCSSLHCHNPPGNTFLGLGILDGMVKIYNVPNFTISSELYFPEMKGKDCVHVKLNLSREAPLITPAYFRNPFRDLILTSMWSDGKVMVCQVAKQ